MIIEALRENNQVGGLFNSAQRCAIDLRTQHAGWVLFVWVFINQREMSVPAVLC